MACQGVPLQTLAERLGGRVVGDPRARVRGITDADEAGPEDISVVFGPRAAERARRSSAGALVAGAGIGPLPVPLIEVSDPRRALIELLHWFHPPQCSLGDVHPRAVVAPGARLGQGVSVGPGAVIGERAVLEEGVRVHAHVVVGEDCRVGRDTEIFPQVTLYPGTWIGRRVRIHAGTVIGSDGFGYLAAEDGTRVKIPQVGRVEIGDDVEIGANCTIDRASLGTTRILTGTKIDNLVQVGHNCRIGQHCVLVAQVGISGSVVIGDHCTLAGQVGVGDHVTLADRTVVGGQSGVVRDLASGRYLGYPAMESTQALRTYYLLPRLPEIYRELKTLKARLEMLDLGPDNSGTGQGKTRPGQEI